MVYRRHYRRSLWVKPRSFTVEFVDCNGCVGNDTITILANPVPGCTNPNAINYNISANVDDGSCIVPVDGCTDPNAINYNPLAIMMMVLV